MQLGVVHLRLVAHHRALQLRHQGLLGIQLLLGRCVLGDQVAVAVQVNLGVGQLCLVPRQGALGLGQRDLVGAWVDLCQQRTSFD